MINIKLTVTLTMIPTSTLNKTVQRKVSSMRNRSVHADILHFVIGAVGEMNRKIMEVEDRGE